MVGGGKGEGGGRGVVQNRGVCSATYRGGNFT